MRSCCENSNVNVVHFQGFVPVKNLPLSQIVCLCIQLKSVLGPQTTHVQVHCLHPGGGGSRAFIPV